MRGTKAGRLPSTRGTIARHAYAVAKAAGVALEPLTRQTGLSLQQIEDPATRFPVRSQIRLLNALADALHDDLLGFHLAERVELREIGLLYYVLASSPTLYEALRRGARYTAIVNEGFAVDWFARGDFGLSFRYVGVDRALDRHQIEYWFAGVLRICRQITGQRVVPSRLRMRHTRENGQAELAQFFGRAVEFGAGADDIAFAPEAAALPIVSADPYLNSLLVAHCEQALRHHHRPQGTFRARVEDELPLLLPHGKAKAADVARRLGVSERTFARRLAAEGVTFSRLLEALRSDLAGQYLADPGLSISQIAWLLGYHEVGAFSHAFRRWTGKTPRQTRAAAG